MGTSFASWIASCLVAITQQPFDEIVPAPQHKKEEPLELPKPKLFSPQIPEPLSTPAPIQEPIPTTESTESIEATEFPTPTQQPTPQATELPEVENSEQPIPVVETPLITPDN